jgi:hypothetical protein
MAQERVEAVEDWVCPWVEEEDDFLIVLRLVIDEIIVLKAEVVVVCELREVVVGFSFLECWCLT